MLKTDFRLIFSPSWLEPCTFCWGERLYSQMTVDTKSQMWGTGMSGPTALRSSLDCRPNSSDWGSHPVPECRPTDKRENRFSIQSFSVFLNTECTNFLKSLKKLVRESVIPVLFPPRRTHYSSFATLSFRDHQIPKLEPILVWDWHVYQSNEKKLKV